MALLHHKSVKNFSILTLSNIIVQAFSILSSIRMARMLQPNGYGLFNLVTVQVGIFTILASYGLRLVIIRHVARENGDARKIFKLAIHIRSVTTLVALIVSIAYNLLLKEQALEGALLIALIILIIFQTLWDTIESVSFGFERMEASGYINLIFTILWVAEVYIIPAKYFSVVNLLYVFVFNQITRSIVYYLWVHRVIFTKQTESYVLTVSDYKNIIRQSNYYFILALFTAIQNQIPVLFLQFNSSVDQIGLFNLGYRILSPLQMVLNMLITSLFPMFSRLALTDKVLFATRVKSLLNLVIMLGICGCFCFALFSKDVVLLLYGEQYLFSAKVIVIQCWYTLLYAIFCVIGTVLSSYDKQKQLAALSAIYGVIAIPIFYFGTQKGAVGLAWCFVVAAFVNMTYHWVYFRKMLQNKISWTITMAIFGSIGFFVYLTGNFELKIHLLLKLLIAVVCSTAVIIYLYKTIYPTMKTFSNG